MESNNVQPAGGFAPNNFATDTMNIDMDIDLTTADDIDAFDTEGITIVRPHAPRYPTAPADPDCAG